MPTRRERVSMLCVVGLLGACADSPTGPRVTVTISEPGAEPVIVGDAVHLAASSSDPDVPVQWGSSNDRIARVFGDSVEAVRPGTVRLTASAGNGSASVDLTVTSRPDGYTTDEVDYFLDISLGFEFGNASRIVRKWAQDPTFRVYGAPTSADAATLDDVVADINALTSEIDLVAVESGEAVAIHFAHTDAFPDIVPGYVPGNIGYFSVGWGSTQHINRATVLIATNTDQTVRNHLIREEVTQMLGMARDSFLYPNSIFQQAFTTVDEYAPVDEPVIEILYRPEVIVGMDQAAAGRAARRLIRGVVDPSAPLAIAWIDPAGRGRPGTGAGSGGGR